MHFRLILCFLFIGNIAHAREIIPRPNSYHVSKGTFKVPGSLAVEGKKAAG